MSEEEQREAKPKAAVKVPKRVLRARKERPEFVRQESWRYRRLESGWRRPRGKDSKMRLQVRGWPHLVKVGYRSQRRYRGLHPSGFLEVLVHNVEELEGLDPKVHAVRIAGNVGRRKAIAINEAAVAKGLRVLNPAVSE
ncbi:MAG: 50S ribosomal protein L32e [Thaumarchaeota archaeon]|nr:50S ribosomal protein L32e [Candidatus Calditenuaceae archaeon]MDW8042270.1 50S ribosomal protein L32e [Nitrososphaerota archaeon]